MNHRPHAFLLATCCLGLLTLTALILGSYSNKTGFRTDSAYSIDNDDEYTFDDDDYL